MAVKGWFVWKVQSTQNTELGSTLSGQQLRVVSSPTEYEQSSDTLSEKLVLKKPQIQIIPNST